MWWGNGSLRTCLRRPSDIADTQSTSMRRPPDDYAPRFPVTQQRSVDTVPNRPSEDEAVQEARAAIDHILDGGPPPKLVTTHPGGGEPPLYKRSSREPTARRDLLFLPNHRTGTRWPVNAAAGSFPRRSYTTVDMLIAFMEP